MPEHNHPAFLSGVIEGFYGQPWSHADRLQLFAWLREWGMNTYLYAPKDDLKHRAAWREPYSDAELAPLRELIDAAKQNHVRFIYALSPGLDIHYADPAESTSLIQRFHQLFDAGCEHFSLLFDDLPDRMHPPDARQFGSLASAQAHVTNPAFRWLRERVPDARLLFCPTPYCSRMAAANHGGAGYLETIGRELLPEIDVFWTGPEIISREITLSHIQELQKILHRKPLIWDNLHANDYDGRRFFCGPYSGREPAIREAVSGLLTNPNNEFALNYIPLRTMAEFIRSRQSWEPRRAYLDAMQHWAVRFATVTGQIPVDQLILFFDCYYLPYEDGAEAVAFYDRVRQLVLGSSPELLPAFRQQTAQFRELFTRLPEIRERPLFYGLARRLWELREEVDLLDKFATHKFDGAARGSFTSDYHLPGPYRGSFAARLQALLEQHPDGAFTPARSRDTDPFSLAK
jgi:protein O-GlcNAcase/histone acetyltransferase